MSSKMFLVLKNYFDIKKRSVFVFGVIEGTKAATRGVL